MGCAFSSPTRWLRVHGLCFFELHQVAARARAVLFRAAPSSCACMGCAFLSCTRWLRVHGLCEPLGRWLTPVSMLHAHPHAHTLAHSPMQLTPARCTCCGRLGAHSDPSPHPCAHVAGPPRPGAVLLVGVGTSQRTRISVDTKLTTRFAQAVQPPRVPAPFVQCTVS